MGALIVHAGKTFIETFQCATKTVSCHNITACGIGGGCKLCDGFAPSHLHNQLCDTNPVVFKMRIAAGPLRGLVLAIVAPPFDSRLILPQLMRQYRPIAR